MSPRPSSRETLLDTALALVRAGEALSLDSVARAAGLSKPGLMYHFATKEALMTGLVDHVLARYQGELRGRLTGPAADATPEQRLAAYVEWTFTADIDQADLVMFTDPRLREQLTVQWAEQMQAWVDVASDVGPERRARLLAARLLADGSWFADASGVLPLADADRAAVFAVARSLMEVDR